MVAEILGGAVDQKGKGNAQMRGPGGIQAVPKQDATRVVELAPSMQMLSEQLEREIRDGKVHLSLEPRGLVVSLRESAYFPSGGDAIPEETHDSLSKVAEVMHRVPNPVRLEGHTDSVPIHNIRFRSNWDLSAARGIAMLELFASQFGIPRDRMAIAGYAETAPVDTNETVEGRSHNRRVDIVFLNQYGLKSEPAQQHQEARAPAKDEKPAPAPVPAPAPPKH